MDLYRGKLREWAGAGKCGHALRAELGSHPHVPLLLILLSALSAETLARLRELRNTPQPQEHKVLVFGLLPGGGGL